MIWPKHVTVSLCGMISCDGSINCGRNNQSGDRNAQIYIFYSVELEWIKQIKKVLLEKKNRVLNIGAL